MSFFAKVKQSGLAVGAAMSSAVLTAMEASKGVVESTRNMLPEPSNVRDQREKERLEAVQQEREERVDALLAGTLQPYEPELIEDTWRDKTARVGTWGVNIAADYYGSKYARVLRTLLRCSQYGVAAFIFREDLAEIVSTMANLMGDVYGLSAKDVAIGLYYMFAFEKLKRSADPAGEQNEHGEQDAAAEGIVQAVAPDELLCRLGDFLPLAMAAYSSTTDEVGWKCARFGYKLVVSHADPAQYKPAYHLLAHEETKMAVLAVCGTSGFHDVITDAQAMPSPLGGGYCHSGMLLAARWLLDDQGARGWLQRLHEGGYSIVLTGHSLGAGVATLAGFLLRNELPRLRVYSFAPPACLSESLADNRWVRERVLSVVLRDDMVSRISVVNINSLAAELSAQRNEWEPVVNEDFDAFKRRAATLWAPARRQPTKAWADRPHPAFEPAKFVVKGSGAGDSDGDGDGDGEGTVQMDVLDDIETPSPAPQASAPQALSAAPDKAAAVVVADAAAALTLAAASTSGPAAAAAEASAAASASAMESAAAEMDVDVDVVEEDSEQFYDMAEDAPVGSAIDAGKAAEAGSGSGAEVEGLPGLPRPPRPPPPQEGRVELKRVRLVPPGQIVHIYAYMGTLRASVVDHRWKGFQRFSLHSSMLNDHKPAELLHAMRSVRAARRAALPPPHWCPSNDDAAATCAVCRHDVTWSRTSSSEAERARAMHHCRACGQVVCHGCSERTMTLPCYGIISPVRVCDSCFWHGTVSAVPGSL